MPRCEPRRALPAAGHLAVAESDDPTTTSGGRRLEAAGWLDQFPRADDRAEAQPVGCQRQLRLARWPPDERRDDPRAARGEQQPAMARRPPREQALAALRRVRVG